MLKNIGRMTSDSFLGNSLLMDGLSREGAVKEASIEIGGLSASTLM